MLICDFGLSLLCILSLQLHVLFLSLLFLVILLLLVLVLARVLASYYYGYLTQWECNYLPWAKFVEVYLMEKGQDKYVTK